jgi:hypothetical protein
MDALALFTIPFFMTMAAHEASMAQYRYTQAAQERPPYAYSVPPGHGWAPGAVMGAGVGGIAGGGGGALAGAMLGGSIGYAATMPPPYAGPVAYTPPSRMALRWESGERAASPSAEPFISRWQSFMQPSARR